MRQYVTDRTADAKQCGVVSQPLLCFHSDVIEIGRGASEANILILSSLPFCSIQPYCLLFIPFSLLFVVLSLIDTSTLIVGY